MKQFCFSSNLFGDDGTIPDDTKSRRLSPRITTDIICRNWMPCLSQCKNESFVTKELIEAWDSAKPYLANRTKIQRHNSIRSFAAFAYAHDGLSYVPDASKLKSNPLLFRIFLLLTKSLVFLLPPIVCHTGKMHRQGIWLFLLSLGCFMPVDYVLMRH